MGRLPETIDDGPPPMEDHDLYEPTPPPPPPTTHRSTPPQYDPPPPPTTHRSTPPQQFPPQQDPEAHHFPPPPPQQFPPPHEAHHFPPQQFPPTQDPEVHHFPPPSPQQFPPPPEVHQFPPQQFPPPQQDHGVHQFPPPYEDDGPVKPPPQQVMGQVFTPPPPQQQTAYQFTPQNQYQQNQNIPNGIPLGIQQNQLPTQPWNTGLFDCMDNPQNALITFLFPCVTFGQIAEIVDSGSTSCGTSGMMYSVIMCCIAMPCIMSCTYRTKLRSKYGLVETPGPDWLIHCFCEYCALCQEYRELEKRGFDPSIGWLGNEAKQQQKQQQFGMTPPTQQRMY